MSYAIIILLVAVLILVHEIGHLLTGMWVKIPIERFSVGFGPKIWGFKRKSIEYQIAAVPLGGYVLPKIPSLEAYFKIPLWKRVLFSLGGPVANFLFPIPVFAAINVVTGGFSFEGVFVTPFAQTFELIYKVFAAIPGIFANTASVSGPVGVVTQGAKFAGMSADRTLFFAALLSVNLAIFNLFPLPILDGGKILMSLFERVWPKAGKFAVHATVISLVLLLVLFAAATVGDITKLVR